MPAHSARAWAWKELCQVQLEGALLVDLVVAAAAHALSMGGKIDGALVVLGVW